MEEKFKEKLKNLLNEIDVPIEEEQLGQFYIYMKLLLEWNKKMNLTAITEQDEIIVKHFVDSLSILKDLKPEERIVDIGTGAGFPGIPLAILSEKNHFTLVDSLNKRIHFLNEVKEKLGLENVTTIHMRAEEFGQNKMYREKFDVAVARAVANLSVLIEYLFPVVKLGGKIICMKGSKIEEELQEARFAMKELGGVIDQKEEFYLPGTDMKRNLIIFQKIKPSPKKYPRKPGQPAKQPLK